MKNIHKLTSRERDLIAIWRSRNTSIRQIAKQLERSPSTISRELRQNRWGAHYVAIHAQTLTKQRISTARKRHPLKNKSVYKYVMRKLRSGWSPEQITGRIQIDLPGLNISHEAIYQYVYDLLLRHKSK